MEKINIHSITDLITNSSTVIYTFSDGCPTVLEELVDEFFKSVGLKEKCKDIFDVTLKTDMASVYDMMCYRLSYLDVNKVKNTPKKFIGYDNYAAVAELIENITAGKVKKPKWFIAAEQDIIEENGQPETTLCIVAKDPKYENLAQLLVKFLYSTEHEEHHNG
jgi:hypothetical protein